MTDDRPEPEGRPLGRRAFLVMVGAGLTSLAWGGSALDVASKSTLVLPEPIRRATSPSISSRQVAGSKRG